VISKTEAMLITIHRQAFQHMIAGSDEDAEPDAELVPESSGSFASRALRKVRDRITGLRVTDMVMSEAGSAETLKRSPTAQKTGSPFNLQENFSASQMSRTDVAVAYNPEVTAQSLLERAAIARSTMKTWCELRGMEQPAFVTMPLPSPLQELQVWSPSRAGRLSFVFLCCPSGLSAQKRFEAPTEGQCFICTGATHGEHGGRHATQNAGLG
jgi:hypothetical protein